MFMPLVDPSKTPTSLRLYTFNVFSTCASSSSFLPTHISFKITHQLSA